ncbi:hypothetical protein AFK68_12580 [Hydrocoleum sp. CS-953]|nr:hypothetical protein AFK68_12580 [Hydrocoleum sp. CS-953]
MQRPYSHSPTPLLPYSQSIILNRSLQGFYIVPWRNDCIKPIRAYVVTFYRRGLVSFPQVKMGWGNNYCRGLVSFPQAKMGWGNKPLQFFFHKLFRIAIYQFQKRILENGKLKIYA